MSENSRQVKRSRFWQLRIGERRVMLLIGDLTMALIALGIALIYWGSSERFIDFSLEFLQKRTPVWFYFLPIIWLLLLIELYDINKASDWGKTIRGIFSAGAVGIVLYLLLYFYYFDPPESLLPRRGVASFLIVVALLTLLWRALYIRVFAASQFMRRVLLVGGGKSGKLILQIINELNVKPFFLVGIVDDDLQKLGQLIEGYKVMGSSGDLLSIVEEQQISDIIVAITGEMQGNMFQVLLDTQERGVEITRMPVAYEELLGRVPIRTLEANWILRSFVDETRVSSFYILGKRLLDMLGGLVGVLGLVLVFPLVTIAILLDDGLPVIYRQVRSGRGGHLYRIIKFRTMRRDAEADGHARTATKDDERATRIGRILRKTHIDELPQFLKVLSGDMSLVGPRAERPELIQMFQERIPFYRARLLVKPGVTGWAQVNQTYASTTDETIIKLEYDLYYIKHRNLVMDMIILLRTPAMVLGFRGL
jgi:exopolysaccharide biosynthesis polyprenyl glycosylphosphotransferase